MRFAHKWLGGGSSPRVRGTLFDAGRTHGARRFIPACAGNAASTMTSCPLFSVHPRVCGERVRLVVAHSSFSGSSPRVRGTRPRCPRAAAPARFIPACAGNAAPVSLGKPFCAVHPRVCGERDEEGEALLLGAGSSPRVRGTPSLLLPMPDATRFIPACAGNATSPRSQQSPRRGSSPRVRGTLLARPSGRCGCRFIPACAGNA